MLVLMCQPQALIERVPVGYPRLFVSEVRVQFDGTTALHLIVPSSCGFTGFSEHFGHSCTTGADASVTEHQKYLVNG